MIIRNSVKCGECGDEVESIHRHNMVTCGCGNVSADGGHAYLRRMYKTGNWEDTSIQLPELDAGGE